MSLPLRFLEQEAASAEPLAKPAKASDRPGLALIGCGGRGTSVGKDAIRFGDMRALCDVDRNQAERAAKAFTKDGKVPEICGDFRQIMERKDIHIVINGTTDHWHTLINMAAAKAGKDIYAEKPLTLTINEGQRLVKLVREKQVVLQTGTQQRSDKNFRLACELVRAQRLYASNDHMGNFFECVGTRKDPICDVETGHRSASECHLANISLRLGRKLAWDAQGERFTGEGAPEANQMLAREMRKPCDYTMI